ncbi:MAG: hypothetical protein ACI3YC_02130 [Alloprevotella sp.]
MKIFLLSLLLVGIAVALLAVRLFFGRNFVNMHTDSNPALRKKGIPCARTQDAQARKRRPLQR